MATTRTKRESAWRVFAREFNSATVELPSQDQYAPSYVLSPLGAMINRVYLTGVLTECENVGTPEEPLWRGRVSDPTDVFYISAGQFQPRAAQLLAEFEPPVLVGIVGKARTYSPEEGTTYVSVRVEMIKEITQEIRDYWILEACQNLYQRLNCMGEALGMAEPDIGKLVALGYSKNISKGIFEAINQFGTIDIEPYNELLTNTLKELSLDTSTDRPLIPPEAGEVSDQEFVTGTEISKQFSDEDMIDNAIDHGDSDINIDEIPISELKSTKEDKEKDEVDNAVVDTSDSGDSNIEFEDEITEQLVFDIINSLIEDKPEGVGYEEVQLHAMENGIDKAIVEECLGSLIDKGVIYEPSIGLIKSV